MENQPARLCVNMRCAWRSTGASTMRPSIVITPPPEVVDAATTRLAHSSSVAPGENAALTAATCDG
jgi:hypothetical protein